MAGSHCLGRGARTPGTLGLAFALCVSAAYAWAQTTESSGGDDSLDGAPGEGGAVTVLDTISVTATRNPIEAFEYPGMVTVLGHDEIRTRQPSTPGDVLRFVPGVEFLGGPRRTGQVPSIRGFQGADVIVTLDGARQNFGSAHDGRFFIDPSLLGEVEVLRGPASSLYGSGGTGGLIGFVTLDEKDLLGPDERAGSSISGGYRSVNSERTGNYTAYASLDEGADLIASVTKRDSGTIELSDGNELENTDDDILTGFAKVGAAFSDHHRLEGSVIAFRNDAREPNNSQEGIDSNQTAVGLVDKDIRAETLRAAYSYHNPADDLLDLDLVAYRTNFQADELRLEDVDSGPRGELLKRDVATLGVRLDNRSRFAFSDLAAATITYGGEFWRDEQDGEDAGMRNGSPDANARDRDGVPDADARFAGLFAQAEISIGDLFGPDSGELLIIPGVRYDDYTISSSDRLAGDNEHREISPRLGVSLFPSEWLMLFANYAHAFRAPTLNEVYLTGVHFPLFNTQRRLVGFNRFEPNPELEPQRTRTVEVGAGVTFNGVFRSHDRFQAKATHFRIRGEDFIDLGVRQDFPVPADCIPFTSDQVRVPAGPSGVFITGCEGGTFSRNVPNARLWGTEAEASYESSRIRVSLGFSSIDGENEDTGAKLGVLTPDQYTLDAGFKLNELDSILGWRVLAASRFDAVDAPEDERPGYAVHDLYFSWRPSHARLEGLRVDLGLDNAFDKAYTRVDNAAAEPGRSFNAGVSYSLAW